MFDFSLGEMLVVALVALVVLGPERLPKAARFAGLWVRRARAQWHSVRTELEQELASEELKRSLQDTKNAITETDRQLQGQLQQTQTQLHALASLPPNAAEHTAVNIAVNAAANAEPPAGVAPLAAERDPQHD
ncbi:MAG TPA: Sec-independent protein translocase protein TatB [Thermomonas sp.]|uniref:Sec-independent protein translocase protein TatB n=1 Tax=Thermomonas sp. TaxID=1971895 RepID=UPI002B852CEB|nr:Sec-independent protein translocase protein TatB [Thermomonas sp.]HOV97135.1 Sec-independent protein translocase protein TatB [Thermomonas sp.]